MQLRVELTDDAFDDLKRYSRSGNLHLFLKKLVALEENGEQASLPLGGYFKGWRKIPVGDRDWRIVFCSDPAWTVATIWVIGDRADSECYDLAKHRIQQLKGSHPHAISLAAIMLQLSELFRATKKEARRKK